MALLPIYGTTIPPQAITMATPSGTTSTSDTIQAGSPGLALLVNNTSGAARNLLVDTPTSKDVYGAVVPNISIALPTSGLRLVRLPNDLADSGGLIGVGVDNVTGVTYAAVSL